LSLSKSYTIIGVWYIHILTDAFEIQNHSIGVYRIGFGEHKNVVAEDAGEEVGVEADGAAAVLEPVGTAVGLVQGHCCTELDLDPQRLQKLEVTLQPQVHSIQFAVIGLSQVQDVCHQIRNYHVIHLAGVTLLSYVFKYASVLLKCFSIYNSSVLILFTKFQNVDSEGIQGQVGVIDQVHYFEF